eukprot:COSAG02_NODE_7568_length_2956_cov_1.381036_4_plen_173_part_00
MLNTGRGMEVEAICEHGTVTSLNDGETWEIRERRGIHSIDPQFREKMSMSQLDRNPEPLAYEPRSSSLQCVEDLCRSLDTKTNPRGGYAGSIALQNMHLLVGFAGSFAQGGAKVKLPLVDHGGWRLHIGDEILLAPDRRLPSFERRESFADDATDDDLAEAAGVLATADARL